MANVYVITAPTGNNLNGLTADAIAAKCGGKVCDFAKTAGMDAALDKAGAEAKLKECCAGAGDNIVLLNYMGTKCDDADAYAAIGAVGSIHSGLHAADAGLPVYKFRGDEQREYVEANLNTKSFPTVNYVAADGTVTKYESEDRSVEAMKGFFDEMQAKVAA